MQVMHGKEQRNIESRSLKTNFMDFFLHTSTFSALLVDYISEGFKAHWLTTLVKDSRLTGSLH